MSALLGPRSIRRTLVVVAALVAVLFVVHASSGPAAIPQGRTVAQALHSAAQFPLKVSPNRRYLVDQRGRPFLVVGDSPQALIGDLSVKDAGTYLADREQAGFNAIWVNLLCNSYTGCRSDGATYDGIKPFLASGDLSRPNPAYFKRADAIIRLAGRHHIVVFLDPIETGGWLDVLRKNGVAKDRAYGRFLGQRYRRFGNVVWWNGNDFQSWRDKSDDAVVLAVARGIRSTDSRHLQTIELNYHDSGSLDDPRWRSIIGLDGAYTYYPTYARVLTEYKRKKYMPVFMQEAGYEFEQNASWISPGSPEVLRRQEYWSALSGATGQFYGNRYTWQFISKWQDHLDTAGSDQFGYLSRLLEQLPWFRLAPDFRHRVVTGGYGTYERRSNVASSNYVTAAATPNRRLALAYLPAGGTVSVNMARFAGKVLVRWFDPANGRFRLEPGSRRPNAGVVRLTAPGTNSLGDPDWLLVLTA